MSATTIGKIPELWSGGEIRVEFIADPLGNESICISRYEGPDDDDPIDAFDVDHEQVADLIRLLNMSRLMTMTADDLREATR